MKNRANRKRTQQPIKKNPEQNKQKSKDPSEAIAIDTRQFSKYLSGLEEKNGDIKCEACGGAEWAIPPDADFNGKPSIITLPLPLHKGLGMWSLPIICTTCGNMKFFSVPSIIKALKEDQP